MRFPVAFKPILLCMGAFLLGSLCAAAQTPATSLLVLEKKGTQLDIIDPTTLQIVAKEPAGPDPHEVIASADGRLAFISNYGGAQSSLHTISVVDLVAQKRLPAIDLGALHGAHGLDFAGGEPKVTVSMQGRFLVASTVRDGPTTVATFSQVRRKSKCLLTL